MKLRRLFFLLLSVFALILLPETPSMSSESGKGKGVKFVRNESAGKVDILIGGRLVTSYCWPDNVYKPIFYPVFTLGGTEITRGFPLRPRAGERDDHIHQVGIWFNYGNVNGVDFWGNGSEGRKSENGGVIKHLGITKLKGDRGEGIMTVASSWLDPSGKELLAENTEFHIIAKETYYIIDRLTTLKSTGNIVTMKDTKEGMYAIRVARQLELPSEENVRLLDVSGKPGSETAGENRGVTGNYRSSEGINGEAVWGTRARWMNLSGIKGNEKISITICDHPGNVSYPTYWHARGYGLFSANPLGGADFTKGEEIVNFSVGAGESVKFRYRIIINSGRALSDKEINLLADEFASSY